MKKYEVIFEYLEDGEWENEAVILALDPQKDLRQQCIDILTKWSVENGTSFKTDTILILKD